MQLLRSTSLLVLLIACSNREPASNSAPPSRAEAPTAVTSAAKPVAAAATPYTSTAGRFTQRVTFGDANEKTLDDPNGGTWHTTIWKTSSAQLMVQYADYESHAVAFAETHGFIPTRDKSEIKRDEKITIDGLEGRELEWQVASGTTMWLRFLIADNRVYKVGGGYKGDRADTQKFIDGFAIIPTK